MHTFPSFLRLARRPVLVIGGGENAARKIRLLLKAEAAVIVVAPEINSEIAGLAAAGRIVHWATPFSPAHLDQMRLAISAVGDATDEAVAAAAQTRGVLVNVVDRPELSDFLVPAIVERGDITVGIASNGTAPLLLGRIRAQIEALLPARLGDLAALAGEFRRTVARVIADGAQRKRFWERVFDGPVAAKSLAGDKAAARTALLAALNGPQNLPRGENVTVNAGDDPDQLTLAEHRALSQADIVLHDADVAPAILDRVRRDAERFAVTADDDVESRIVTAVAAGRRVVRLTVAGRRAAPQRRYA